jgi:hypothetical protein
LPNRRTVTILTPVAPRLAAHLPETARSVSATVAAAVPAGFDVHWMVVVDGPGDLPPDVPALAEPWARVVRLPFRSGVSAARNIGLAAARDGWILPLDGDDELDPGAVLALLQDRELAVHDWASSNRVLTGGGHTVHWRDTPRRWPAGRLAEEWRAPLQFHPNSVLVQRSLALAVGGWPALPSNEDHLFALLLSEHADGVSTTHAPLRYRRWDRQVTATSDYTADRHVFHDLIVAVVNAARGRQGRTPVPGPRWPEATPVAAPAAAPTASLPAGPVVGLLPRVAGTTIRTRPGARRGGGPGAKPGGRPGVPTRR